MLRVWVSVLAAVFITAGPVDAQESPRLAPDALRADLAQLYAGLQSGDIDLFAHTARADLDKAYAQAERDLAQPLSIDQAQAVFQSFVAKARQGHARIATPDLAWQRFRDGGGAVVPLNIRFEGQRAYITADWSGGPVDLAGRELLSLNGRDMAWWLGTGWDRISAEDAYMAGAQMEGMGFAKLVWGLEGAKPDFSILTLSPDGARSVDRLPARSRAEILRNAATGAPRLDLGWAREARMLDGGLAYLRPGPFFNTEAKTDEEAYDNGPFRTFIDTSFATFKAAGARALLIDLRDNPGGDNSFSDLMLAWIADRPFRFFQRFTVKASPEAIAANRARLGMAGPAGEVSRLYAAAYANAPPGARVDVDFPYAQPRAERFAGKVYVLINRRSFSNATNVAAVIQDYGLGVVLGEPTSDMATAHGAMETFTLDHSRLVVGFPKALIVRPSGDLTSRGVQPDVKLMTPVVQTPADEILKAAQAHIRAAG